jgi:hypothetical protein
MAEMLAAIAKQDPARAAFSASYQAMLATARHSRPSIELAAMFNDFPEAETRGRLPDYREDVTTGLFGKTVGFEENGFNLIAHPDQNFTTVKFRSRRATLQQLDELALLKGSEVSKAAGKGGMIVVARRSIRHLINAVPNMRGTGSPDGYEVQLDIMPVDPKSPPAKYQTLPWKILDVNAVYAALAPVYLSQTAGQ